MGQLTELILGMRDEDSLAYVKKSSPKAPTLG